MKNETNFYRTRDLAESAALIINKQHLIRLERIGKTCWFIFEDQTQCAKISNEYFFGDLLVKARDYHETITRLKNRIFANS